MGLASALFSSVTGLDIQSTAISIIGDNIANVSTPGFKERRIEFSDVLGQTIGTGSGFSEIGAGVKTATITRIYSQGTFETTVRGTDLAIDGKGFFLVDNDRGRFYTRAGMFNFDENGLLVDRSGSRVQGFGIDPLTNESNGQLGDLQVQTAVSDPRASTQLQMSVNLDANAAVSGPFDPGDPNNTSNHRVVINVYDSLGNAVPATVFYSKTAANTWEYNVTLAASDTTEPPATVGDEVVVQPSGTGTLTFASDGTLTGAAPGGNPRNVVFEFAGGASASQVIAVSFGPDAASPTLAGDPTTQFGLDSNTNSFNQDGFGAGTLQTLSIDRNGFLSAQFSNGETRNIGRLALANFPNLEGLVSVGNNNLIEARASGQPLIASPGEGAFGEVRSNALESSNVDLAAQFVKLIVSQRAFQANTRTISATNELLANLVSLGQ